MCGRRLDLCFGRETCLLDGGLPCSNVGLIRLQRGNRVVQILLWRCFFFHQGTKTIHILLGFEKVCLGLSKIRFRLKKRHLFGSEFFVCFALRKFAAELLHVRFIWTEIEDVQGLPGLHIGARFEQPLLDVAIDPPTYLNHIASERLRGVVAINRNIFAGNRDDRDFGRSRHRSRIRYAGSRVAAGKDE